MISIAEGAVLPIALGIASGFGGLYSIEEVLVANRVMADAAMTFLKTRLIQLP